MTASESPSGRESILGNTGRDLGSTRGGQILVAILIATLFGGLAYLAWNHRDLAARIFAFYLIIRGVAFAERALPITKATRARWAEDEKIIQRCPASLGRIFLLVGIARIIVDWGEYRDKPSGLIFNALMVIGGLFCYVLCRRHLKRFRADQGPVPS